MLINCNTINTEQAKTFLIQIIGAFICTSTESTISGSARTLKVIITKAHKHEQQMSFYQGNMKEFPFIPIIRLKYLSKSVILCLQKASSYALNVFEFDFVNINRIKVLFIEHLNIHGYNSSLISEMFAFIIGLKYLVIFQYFLLTIISNLKKCAKFT